jgi:hypothetical protein
VALRYSTPHSVGLPRLCRLDFSTVAIKTYRPLTSLRTVPCIRHLRSPPPFPTSRHYYSPNLLSSNGIPLCKNISSFHKPWRRSQQELTLLRRSSSMALKQAMRHTLSRSQRCPSKLHSHALRRPLMITQSACAPLVSYSD